MTPKEFIERWRHSGLKERSAAQSHFNDICSLLGEAPPHVADPTGERFCFERGAKKTGGGDGWADYTPDIPYEEILARLFKLNQEMATE